MMIVPRQYTRSPPRTRDAPDLNEKSTFTRTRSPSNSARAPYSLSTSPLRLPQTPTNKLEPHSKPVTSRSVSQVQDAPPRPQSTPVAATEVPRFRRESTQDLLSSTAIPIRRKPRGRLSQRLPKGDHVADFSRLLMEDVKPVQGSAMSRSISSSNFDGLFGNMDELLEEGQMYVGSEGLDSGVLSARSVSEESFASLTSPDDFNASDRNSQHSSVSQSGPERKLRQNATSEDCSDDHPLSLSNDEDDFFMSSPEFAFSPTITLQKLPVHEERKSRSPLSLKSSLTASLKALKSAAQSVSTRSMSSSSQTGKAQARSFFDFEPALTDDRRPPPSFESPTPELRRYLNPRPLDSAAQLHFWQDHRHSKTDLPQQKKGVRRPPKNKKSPLIIDGNNLPTRDLPPVVQLADCLPPSVRTEHASSPPIWLTRDGTPANKTTAIPLLFDPNANNGKGEPAARHREPRENRDFLRVFVCEMQMRRSGKLSDDLGAGRARLWLPPIDAGTRSKTQNVSGAGGFNSVGADKPDAQKRRKEGSERLTCLSIDDV